jgi:hypothetical protein
VKAELPSRKNTRTKETAVNDPNKTTAVDERIARVIARRAGASSSERFEILREDGTETLRNRVGAGQIDATVACSQFKEPEKPKGFVPADIKNFDPIEPSPEECIVIGNVTIRPNPIANTWEGRLTPGGTTAHEVLLDGERVVGDRAITVVYEVLRSRQSAKKGAK